MKYVIVADGKPLNRTFPSYRDAYYHWTHSMNHLDHYDVRIKTLSLSGEIIEEKQVNSI